MRRESILRATFAACIAASAACTDGASPVGAPGGRDGLELLYATPRLRVVAAGEVSSVRIALIVRRRGDDGASTPLAEARLEVEREEGLGVLSAASATTGPDGLAAVDVRMPDGPDLTRIVFRMADDPGSYLPFDVVSAPVADADLAPGEIRARLDVPKDGVILRFPLQPDSDIVLIPYETDPDRTGASYRLLHQGATPGGGAAAFGVDPPRLPQSLAPGAEAGDVVEAEERAGRGGLGPATVPQSLDIASCMVSASRQAPLRYLGSHIALYVDTPPDAHQARIDSIGRAFDEEIFPRNTELFGITPDYDGNGVMFAVLTPEIEDAEGVYCDTIRRVGTEAIVGLWNPEHPVDRVLAVIAHEHQHVVNAGYHVLSDGSVGDERWINEGLSLAAEVFNGYWRESLIRLWEFLNGQNGGLSMLPLDYVPAFDNRYMAFFLYVEDRFGPGALRTLTQSGRRGVDNVEFATGMEFEDLLRDWFVAVGVSNRGITDDPRYSYRTVDLMGMTDEIAECDCSPVDTFTGMRLEALPLSTSFDIARMLDRADADYYRLVPPVGLGAATYDLYFDAFGREFVQIAVARVR
ncbi:MAG TPA: hypothetical protein VIE68_02620 [Gemmatimonadota bacterium]|jgi:hypothetical protein